MANIIDQIVYYVLYLKINCVHFELGMVSAIYQFVCLSIRIVDES